MSDANKFVNTYIDFAVGQLHENINTMLQLKTQLKIAGDINAEKDAVINQLSQDLEANKANNQEMVKLRDEARKWEDAHNAIAGKATHLDTALSQIADMKKEVIKRDEIIKNLEEQIELLKNPPSKKAINTKVKKELVKEETVKVLTLVDTPSKTPPEKQATDDF